jgi:hypothetical protein
VFALANAIGQSDRETEWPPASKKKSFIEIEIQKMLYFLWI